MTEIALPPPRTRMYDIERITEAEFAAMRDEWDSLLDKSESAAVFQTWEWLHTWWRHYGDGKTLFTLAARGADGRLAGIAPLCISDWKIVGGMSLKTLTFLGTEEVCSDYLDLIVDPRHGEEIRRELLVHLSSQKGLWDCVVLSDIQEGSKTLALAREFLQGAGISYSEATSSECPYAPLPSDYDSFASKLSSSMRYNLKRSTKILKERLHSSFERLDDGSDLGSAMDELFRLHEMRRRALGSAGSFLKDRLVAFHRDVAPALLQKGRLGMFSLRVDGEPAAVLYGFKYNNRYYYYQSGMDPRFMKYSAGQVLLGYSIMDSIESGLSEFDFLRGPEPYKFNWTKHRRNTVNIAFSAGSLKGRAYVIAMGIKNKACRSAQDPS